MADELDQQPDAPLQSEQEKTNQEELKGPPPGHPRWQEVIEEKNKWKENAEQSQKAIESLQTELAELKEQINQRQEESGSDDLTDEEVRALERIDRGLKARGYVTQAELRAERTAIKLDKLSEKYSGSNGLPRFNSVDVVAYAKKNGFGDNYEAAYRDMHYEAFVQSEAKKLSKTVNTPTSERAGGGRIEGLETELTDEDISKMSDEEYEKNREKILSSIKSNIR